MFLTTDDFQERFRENLEFATSIDIATAWATSGPALDMLCGVAEERVMEIRAIVGTFGNATEPTALDRLCEIGELRLIAGRREMFHPKVYIFRGEEQSRTWISSANFTSAGFENNEEIVLETNNVRVASTWFNQRWDECDELPANAIEDYQNRRDREGVSRHMAYMVQQPVNGYEERRGYLERAGSWSEYVAALEQCNEW